MGLVSHQEAHLTWRLEQQHSASARGMQVIHAPKSLVCHVITTECGLFFFFKGGRKVCWLWPSCWQAGVGNSGESEYFHFIVMWNSYSHQTQTCEWYSTCVYTQTDTQVTEVTSEPGKDKWLSAHCFLSELLIDGACLLWFLITVTCLKLRNKNVDGWKDSGF